MDEQKKCIIAFRNYLTLKGYRHFTDVNYYQQANGSEGVAATVTTYQPSVTLDFTSAIKGRTTEQWRVSLAKRDFNNEAITGGLFITDSKLPLEQAITTVLAMMEPKRTLTVEELNNIETTLYAALFNYRQSSTNDKEI